MLVVLLKDDTTASAGARSIRGNLSVGDAYVPVADGGNDWPEESEESGDNPACGGPRPHHQGEKRQDIPEEHRKRLAYDAPHADPSVGPIRAGRVEVRWIGFRVHAVATSRRRRDARLFRSDLSVGHAYVPVGDGGDDRPAGSDQSFRQKDRHSQQRSEVVLSKVAGHAFEQGVRCILQRSREAPYQQQNTEYTGPMTRGQLPASFETIENSPAFDGCYRQ